MKALPRESELTVLGTSKGYNEFYQFPLRTGEWFVDQDFEQGNQVMILAAELAHDLFGTEDVLGNKVFPAYKASQVSPVSSYERAVGMCFG